MGIQEQLAQENPDNFQDYLGRMAASAHFSTKQNIPPIIRSYDCKRILDFGCADGSFTAMIAKGNPQATVVGMDCNPECINQAREKWSGVKDRMTFELGGYTDMGGKYDCIVFCSVMHEISSYSPTPAFRYTDIPITDAICSASRHLNKDGVLIIRDWVHPFASEIQGSLDRMIEFTDEKYVEMFKWFASGDFAAIDKLDIRGEKYRQLSEKDNIFLADQHLIMEFLMTATWGEASWNRETKERRFILNTRQWYEMLEEHRFFVTSYTQTNEEYPRYCSKFCRLVGWEMPETTCLIVAQKVV